MRKDIQTDIAIVGSGAGGSVVAYHLARSGERVTILERGKRIRPEDMTDDEVEMISTIYRDAGSTTNTDADMFLLQGNVVGGSTVLTNAVCFRMPEEVRRSLAEHGWDLPAEDLAGSYARCESVLNVHPLEEELYNPAAWKLVEGMRRLGLEPGRFHKAMLRCIGCGYCNVGCRYGRKLDASMTWIPMAERHGAEVLPETRVVEIEWTRGEVTGLICRDLSDDSRFRIRARRYVLAGGALNTPELLLRSGIRPHLAGRRTSFNVGALMFAEYEDRLDGFDGDQMCIHHFGDGFAIEQCQNPPTAFALTLPAWFAEHHGIIERYRHIAACGVLVPTQPVGRVFLGVGARFLRRWFDHGDIEFRLPQQDLDSFRRGFETLARIYLASGATRVLPPYATDTVIRSEKDLPSLQANLRVQKDLVGFGSSHPMGGACLGDDVEEDVVGPDFRVFGLDNLFVADASLFPVSIRVNPMLSIMAVADHAVRSIGGFRPEGPIEEGPAHAARLQGQARLHVAPVPHGASPTDGRDPTNGTGRPPRLQELGR